MRRYPVVLLCVLVPAAASGQTTGLGGTWQLDKERSSVSAEATLAGLIGVGAPAVLHITQPANGTLVVESQVNESHARLYAPGRQTTTPVFLGDAGTITMMTRWDDAKLVSEGTRGSASTARGTEVKEAFEVSADGHTLTIEITTSTADETSTSTLRYTPLHDVGPCDSWPSPCKDFSSLERR